MAEEQEKLGASILDVNMGMNGIDEKEMMLRAVNELTMTVDLPLSIDSSYVDVVESALRIYPGRALINSISLEPEKFEKLIPIAKKKEIANSVSWYFRKYYLEQAELRRAFQSNLDIDEFKHSFYLE